MNKKIVVFDDDPTGSQTVYGCPLLLKWDKKILNQGINDSSKLLFLLTNTRSLPPELAEKRIKEICRNLKEVIKENDFNLNDICFITRGDSTLRGHGYLEPKVINDELGPFDATFHVPSFFEGGRTTEDGIHLLNGIPVHETIFAKDKTFGFSTSNLANWLEVKSNYLIDAKNVSSISLKQLDDANTSAEGMENLINFLSKLSFNQLVTVDSKYPHQLSSFANAINSLIYSKRFLFRSAASLINALSNIYSCKNIKDFSSLKKTDEFGIPKSGLIVVGSHVKLADAQIEFLLRNSSCIGVELPVTNILRAFKQGYKDELLLDIEKMVLSDLNHILDINKTPLFYTSRGEINLNSSNERMNFGIFLASFMAGTIAKISNKLGYIISKGGITTNILLSEGLNLPSVYLQGQILPGLSVVSSQDRENFGLPVITFPGNLGENNTLFQVWNLMESKNKN